MSKILSSIDPGYVVELLKDNGDGTGQARVVELAEWEECELGAEITITLAHFEEKSQ